MVIQNSDTALRGAQGPGITLGWTPNYNGTKAVMAGTVNYGTFNYTGASQVDFTGATFTGTNNIGITANGVTHLDGLAGVVSHLGGAIGTLSLQDCGLTNVDAPITAANSGSSTLNVADNTIAGGAIGVALTPTAYGTTYNLINCGLTTCPAFTIAYGGCNLYLTGNSFTTVDLTNGGAATQNFDNGNFLFGNPSLTTVAPGDGTTTGIVSASYATISFQNSALNNANENNLLSTLVAMQAVWNNTFTLDISGGTNAVPDGTGAGLISTLTGAGCTIITN